MPVEGAIAERARGILPVTWDALSGDARYGDGLLQSSVDTAKESVLGQVILPADELSLPLIVINFVAKIVALEVIPAGIDFWMSEPIGLATTGTNEAISYVDRPAQLGKLRDMLLQETRTDATDIAGVVGYRRSSSRSRMKISTPDDLFLTPSPQEFPRPYTETGRS